jgi:hypothetical protein
VIAAMKQGFLVGDSQRNFVNSAQAVNTTEIGSTGQGSYFRFTLDESALEDSSTESDYDIIDGTTDGVAGSNNVFIPSSDGGAGLLLGMFVFPPTAIFIPFAPTG